MCEDIRMSDEELLQTIAVQYRTAVQMNRLLNSMVEEARSRNLVRELFQMQMSLDADEGVSHEDRPPMVI
jgi:hypothetical protein